MAVRRMKCCDRAIVNSILRDKDVYPWISDDGSPHPSVFDVKHLLQEESDVVIVLGWWDSKWKGIWTLHQRNAITYEAHIGILPEYRGLAGITATKEATKWMWDNTKCRKIIAFVPSCNDAARHFVSALGMSREGELSSSFMRDGTLFNEVIFGISKEV